MDIYIIDTNATAELTEIIDPKTGIAWTSDLLGNHNAGEWDDEREMLAMDKTEFDWWEALVADYQDADNRKNELLTQLSGDAWGKASAAFAELDCDLEDCPRFMRDLCDAFAADIA